MSAATGRHAWPALAVAVLLVLACARAGGPPADPRQAAPAVDSLTVALWRFDEAVGSRCEDTGPSLIAATAGEGTHVVYGRFGSAREFTRGVDSFVHAPDDPALDARGGITVEAWVFPRAFGRYEDTPIAARWTQEDNRQSWLFGIVGAKTPPFQAYDQRHDPVGPRIASPGFHDVLVAAGQKGQLVFAFRPVGASQPRAFVSSQRLVLDHWTHVAVTYDGQVVRFFFDGALDAQYATLSRIQTSDAPLLVGNYLDTRHLTSFSGRLALEVGTDEEPWYAFEGLIDELRISNAARAGFPETGTR